MPLRTLERLKKKKKKTKRKCSSYAHNKENLEFWL